MKFTNIAECQLLEKNIGVVGLNSDTLFGVDLLGTPSLIHCESLLVSFLFHLIVITAGCVNYSELLPFNFAR